jgi:hypothetical protein
MLGHKVGNFSDFFHISPPLTRWMIMAVLGDPQFAKGGGYGGEIDEDGVDFYKKSLGEINHLLVTMKNGRLAIEFGVKKQLKNTKPDDKIKFWISGKISYYIDLNTLNIYDSEY